ncbi:serine hydrolase domain-containing protein [Paenibacillus flagellatus]|uniref:Beta-lactamase-related domain-containing protein n=1 Tax=Paenibacillus flagellatus TaxID=2211139 RepID=A0A2V5KUW2_9BACL|nr:serine hydrolase domain-containing protein [Paenibacillus flagellatus]PYI55797.1 hypothetical protein DLM86_08760 [Paenibacillus flagellatus]
MGMNVLDGAVDCSPEEAGYRPEALRRLDDHFARLIGEGRLLGASYMLSRDGAIFAHRALSGEGVLAPDSIRNVASVMKVVTALAVMRLMESGTLTVDEPASAWISELGKPELKDIRLFHLLTHTSGLRVDSSFLQRTDDPDWLHALTEAPPAAPPGEAWEYCNVGYAVLGEIVARASGEPFHRFVLREIFEPLGMVDTSFDVPQSKQGRVFLIPGKERLPKRSAEPSGGAPRSYGGLFSTLADLQKLGQMMLDGGTYGGNRLFGKRTIELMTRDHLTGAGVKLPGDGSKRIPFGLGLFLPGYGRSLSSPEAFSHGGAGWTLWRVDPVDRFVSVTFVPTSEPYVESSMVHASHIIDSGL